MTTEVAQGLAGLAVHVRQAHFEVQDHGRATVAAAMKAGALLIEAKAQTGHGEWLPWLERTGVPQRSAHVYMRLARELPNSQHAADFGSIREALAYLSAGDADPDDELSVIPGQTDLVEETQPAAEPSDDWQPAPTPATPEPEPEVVDAEPVPEPAPDWAIREAAQVIDEQPPAEPVRDAVAEKLAERRARGDFADPRFLALATCASTLRGIPAPEDVALPPDRGNTEALTLDLNYLNDWLARFTKRWAEHTNGGTR